MKIACLMLLCIGVPDITVEVKVKGNVAALRADTEGKSVVWVPKSDGLTNPFPDDFFVSPKVTAFTGAAGTYRVLAITSIKDEVKYTEVTFTIEGPPVPPPPPLPPDSLPARVKDAYAKDPNPAAAKSERAAKLVGLYTVAIKVADDQTLVTVADLTRELVAAKAGMGIGDDDILREVRMLFAQETSSVLGPSMSMTPFNRDAAKILFARFVNALKKAG